MLTTPIHFVVNIFYKMINIYNHCSTYFYSFYSKTYCNHILSNMVVFMLIATPIRVQFGTACRILDVTRESLRHTIRKDPTFPVPLKQGTSKQSPVFFDYQELIEWHKRQKEAAIAAMEAQ